MPACSPSPSPSLTLLPQVSVYRPPGLQEGGRYELKAEAWAEFDPLFAHFSPSARATAQERAVSIGKQSVHWQPPCLPSHRVPPLDRLSAMLHTKVPHTHPPGPSLPPCSPLVALRAQELARVVVGSLRVALRCMQQGVGAVRGEEVVLLAGALLVMAHPEGCGQCEVAELLSQITLATSNPSEEE